VCLTPIFVAAQKSTLKNAPDKGAPESGGKEGRSTPSEPEAPSRAKIKTFGNSTRLSDFNALWIPKGMTKKPTDSARIAASASSDPRFP
jgi:hypothetical protein